MIRKLSFILFTFLFVNQIHAQRLLDTLWARINSVNKPIVTYNYAVAIQLANGVRFVNNGNILFIDRVVYNERTQVNTIIFKPIATNAEVTESINRIMSQYPVVSQRSVITDYIKPISATIKFGSNTVDLTTQNPGLPSLPNPCDFLIPGTAITVRFNQMVEPLGFLSKYGLQRITEIPSPVRNPGSNFDLANDAAIYQVVGNGDPVKISTRIMQQEPTVLVATVGLTAAGPCGDAEPPTPPVPINTCNLDGPIWTNNDNAQINSWDIHLGDIQLPMDYDGDGIQELLSISVITKWAKIQQFKNGVWTEIWNNSGNGYIGPVNILDIYQYCIISTGQYTGTARPSQQLFLSLGNSYAILHFAPNSSYTVNHWHYDEGDRINGGLVYIYTHRIGNFNLKYGQEFYPFMSADKTSNLLVIKEQTGYFDVNVVSFLGGSGITTYSGTNFIGNIDLRNVWKFGISYDYVIPIDIDGDGSQEIFAKSRSNNYVAVSHFNRGPLNGVFNQGTWSSVFYNNTRGFIDYTGTASIDLSYTYEFIPGDFDGDSKDELLIYERYLNHNNAYLLKYNEWAQNDFVNVWNNGGSGELMGAPITPNATNIPIALCGTNKKVMLDYVPELSSTTTFCLLSIYGECYFSVSFKTVYLNGFAGLYNINNTVNFRTGKTNLTEKADINSYNFNFYPNPVSIYFTLEIELNKSTEVEVKIYDLLGREVAIPQAKVSLPEGNSKIDFRMPDNIPAGIYYLTAKVGDNLETHKLSYTKLNY